MHYSLSHPGQGVLGPTPANYASQPTTLPSAFSIMTLQDPTWHMDTGASSHLNFNAINLSAIFYKRLFSSVHVGDGKSIPVTNTGHSIIPSHHRPLHLYNVLDNLTCHILLRCDSSGDLYPVTKPSTSPTAFLSTSASTWWRQRLGHPGDEVLRVVYFGKKDKLAPRFVGPFEITKRIGLVAYRLSLPEELNGVHDTFHVSNLKKCLVDQILHVPLEKIQVDAKLNFVEERVEILEREFNKLKRSRIPIVKVFSSREELLDWVRKTGYSVGYVVVIKTSKSNESVTLQCDRSGISVSKKKSTKNTGSKKCGCPFELPLPLYVVDAFWKKLDFSPCISSGDNLACEAELEELNAEFNKQFGLPSTTLVRDPTAKKTTRGRPSGRKTHVPPKPSNSSLPKQARHKYINQFPRMFHAFIDWVQDVKADGNCGFRATAVGLHLHEDEWPTIRYRLLQELNMHHQQYVSMFGADVYNNVRDRLNFFNIDECAPMIKWMSMLEIGILIASHFNISHTFNDFLAMSTEPTYYVFNGESIFETDTVFSSREELLDWVRKTRYSVGYVVVIKTSKSNKRGNSF
ncbi:hypothetical protein Tco_0952979, partial [Tanacetum coccineum]